MVADDLRAALARPPGPAPAGQPPAGPGPRSPGLRPPVHGRGPRALPGRRRAAPATRPRPPRTCAPRPTWPWPAGDGGVAFDLLLAAAEQAGEPATTSARAACLAYAATIADRFAAEFPAEVPHDRLRRLVDEAAGDQPGRRPGGGGLRGHRRRLDHQPREDRARPALAAERARRGPADRGSGAGQRRARRRGRGAGRRAGGCARRTR